MIILKSNNGNVITIILIRIVSLCPVFHFVVPANIIVPEKVEDPIKISLLILIMLFFQCNGSNLCTMVVLW